MLGAEDGRRARRAGGATRAGGRPLTPTPRSPAPLILRHPPPHTSLTPGAGRTLTDTEKAAKKDAKFKESLLSNVAKSEVASSRVLGHATSAVDNADHHKDMKDRQRRGSAIALDAAVRGADVLAQSVNKDNAKKAGKLAASVGAHMQEEQAIKATIRRGSVEAAAVGANIAAEYTEHGWKEGKAEESSKTNAAGKEQKVASKAPAATAKANGSPTTFKTAWCAKPAP